MFVSLGRDLQILHAYSFGRDLHTLHACSFGRDLHVLNVCHSVWVVTCHMFACGLHSTFNHSFVYLCLSWELHACELGEGKAVCFLKLNVPLPNMHECFLPTMHECPCRICMNAFCRVCMNVFCRIRFCFFAWGSVPICMGYSFDLCMKGPRAFGFHVGSGFSLSVPFLSHAYIIFTRKTLVFIVAC